MSALVFDLDGTLLDTLEDIARAGNAVLAAHGFPARSLPEYRQLVGRGFRSLIRNALPAEAAATLTEEGLDALVTEARAWYGANLCRSTRPYPGIPEALHGLAEAGQALAVLSNKPHELTVALVRRFFPGVPFTQVFGGRDGMPLKPDPTVLLEMLRGMGVPPTRALYVGDSDVDVFTARNANMTSIGVAWGFRGADELRNAHADHIVTAPAELAAVAEEA